jgi:hypothetical protein
LKDGYNLVKINLKRTEEAMDFFTVRMCITDDCAKQLQIPHTIASASTNILSEFKRKKF